MGKRVEVYLTNEEAQMLDELGDNHSKIIKDAIRSLHANGHNSEYNGGDDLRVAIPISMRLRGLVRETIKEVTRELNDPVAKAIRENAEMEKRQELEEKKRIDEAAKAVTEYIMKGG